MAHPSGNGAPDAGAAGWRAHCTGTVIAPGTPGGHDPAEPGESITMFPKNEAATLARGDLFEALEPRMLLSGSSTLSEAIYMPEGFSAPSVVEVVEVASGLDSGSTEWELWAHYERDGEGDEIVRIAQGTLDARQTQQIAVWGPVERTYSSAEPSFARLVRPNEPYALVLRSDSEDTTALLRHSDFGARTAQYFTNQSDSDYVLAGVRRDEDASRDFIVIYNSSSSEATIELELEDNSGNVYRYGSTVPAERRGGWSIRDLPGLPEGVYTARVSGDQAFVLGGTRYALGRAAATIEMPARSLASAGVIVDVEFDTDDSDPDDTFLFLANSGDTEVQVRFTALTGDGGTISGPASFTVSVAAGDSTRVSLRGQGFTDADDDLSLAYRADAPITVNVVAQRLDQLAFVLPETRASTSWSFYRGFFDEIEESEIEAEDVLLFNPTGSPAEVTVTLRLSDGTRFTQSQTLASLEVATFDGDFEFDASMGFPFEGLFVSLSVESSSLLVAMLENWNPLGQSIEGTPFGAPTGTVFDLVGIAVF